MFGLKSKATAREMRELDETAMRLNMSCVWNVLRGEFRVAYAAHKLFPHDAEVSAYYTDDYCDAMTTMVAMAQHRDSAELTAA